MSHVLVTGAASGIGRAVALEFAAAGCALTLVDADEAGMAQTEASVGGRAVTQPGDLADPEVPSAVLRRAWQRHGPVDVLVNAAGVYPSIDMLEVEASAWDRVYAINVRAPVLATTQWARLAIDAGRSGVVVNISSGAALRSRPGGGPYASSKAALEMATRAAALELGEHGIRVNGVSPGFVAVHSTTNPVSDEYAAAARRNPLGHPGTPEDIARAVAWLAGPNAAWITGEILRVDGGSGTGAFELPRLWPPPASEQEGTG